MLVNGSADPALSATVSGILYARRIIDREQYQAAQRFADLRCAIYGAPLASQSDNSLSASERGQP